MAIGYIALILSAVMGIFVVVCMFSLFVDTGWINYA